MGSINVIQNEAINYRKSFNIYSRNIDIEHFSYNDVVVFGQRIQRQFRLQDNDIAIYTQHNPINGNVEQLIVHADRVTIHLDPHEHADPIEIRLVAAPLIF